MKVTKHLLVGLLLTISCKAFSQVQNIRQVVDVKGFSESTFLMTSYSNPATTSVSHPKVILDIMKGGNSVSHFVLPFDANKYVKCLSPVIVGEDVFLPIISNFQKNL